MTRATPTDAGRPPGAEAPRPPSATASVLGQVLPGIAVAAVVALALTALSGPETYARLGLPDPGAVVTYGLPVLRALTESAAVVTVGFLLLAAVLVPPSGLSWLGADGYRAVRIASWCAAAWAAGALVTTVLAVSDAFGRPVSVVLRGSTLSESLTGLPTARLWLVTAGLALVCLVLCRLALSWGTSVAALGVAVVGFLPAAFGGHSGAGGGHDIAMSSMALHVLAAALWIGGLVAVLVHALVRGADLTTALTRFSALALGCWVVLAVSGVLNAVLRVAPDALLTSTYGALLLVKIGALVLLGVFGAAHRTRTMPEVAAGSRAGLVRLGGVETLIMFATVGVAVALGRTPPPEMTEALPTRVEALLGYSLDGPLDLPGLVTAARPDLLLGTAAVVAAVAYLVGVRVLRRRGSGWPPGRTAAWLAACAVLLVVTSSGIGRYAPAQFSLHMLQQVAALVVVGPLAVLGRPGRLVAAVRPRTDGPPGVEQWGSGLGRTSVGRFLTTPLVATLLLVATPWVLDAGGLFDLLVPEHAGHLAMTGWAVAVGAVFAHVVLTVGGPPRAARTTMVVVAALGLVALAVTIARSTEIVGGAYFTQLGLSWIDRPDDQVVGAVVLGLGAVPLLALLLAVGRHEASQAV
ncbi:bifunctional copper resistance protein CopD/cytochrome c oxidase assembly protein [Actinomycetospora atypica]|uniref:Bifunctional copper resistance protein CopD/cytochrome c oxidase assembly protein n=1 Tax=Actinomycetospora atypica TaxID=1290095 RepID=A0ABV9YT52_9PSEU